MLCVCTVSYLDPLLLPGRRRHFPKGDIFVFADTPLGPGEWDGCGDCNTCIDLVTFAFLIAFDFSYWFGVDCCIGSDCRFEYYSQDGRAHETCKLGKQGPRAH